MKTPKFYPNIDTATSNESAWLKPTVGIILCTEKDETLVRCSGLDENSHLFASRYKLVLPSEEDVSRQLSSLTTK